MSIVLYVFAPFLFFFFLNVVTVYISKKSFGYCIPISLMMATFVVYFGQLLFHTFTVGMVLCGIVCLLGLAIIAIKRNDKNFLNNLLSNGFWTFLIVYFMFALIDYRRHVSDWDEFSHWGKMVKEMIRIDRFYSDPASFSFVHKDYPPFLPLIEMIWCKVSGGFSEPSMTMGLHVFEFSFIIPWVSDRFDRKKATWIERRVCEFLFFVVIAAIIIEFDFSGFNTVYTDIVMPMMYAYIIGLIMCNDIRNTKFGYISILLGTCALMLSKQMSICFILLIIYFYIISEILDRCYTGEKKGKIGYLIGKISGLIIAPVANYAVWGSYVNSLKISGQFDLGQINLSKFFGIVVGRDGSEVQKNAFQDYKINLFTAKQNHGTLELSYVELMLIGLVVVLILYFLFKDAMKIRELVKIEVLFILGTVGYALAMLVLYMFCYNDEEMSVLASYDRYMGSYVISEFLVMALLLVELLRRKDYEIFNIRYVLSALLFCIIIFDSSRLKALRPQVFMGENFAGLHYEANDIINKTSENESLLYIDYSRNSLVSTYMYYYLDGRKMDFSLLWSNVNSDEYENNVNNLLSSNDYIYVHETSDELNEFYSQFLGGATLENYSVYSINKVDGAFSLSIVR